jgi:CO/xanthine dehydrogenase Mo-binding subunit
VVEPVDPIGPFGAKEASEGFTVPISPAIANAVYDAIGVRIKSLPITPEKIIKALNEKG